MVTHDPVAASYANRVLFLSDGQIVSQLFEPTSARIIDHMKSLGDEPDAQGHPALPLGAQAPARCPRSLAVVLGVSFMAGTFIMSTTLDQSLRRPVQQGRREGRRRRAGRGAVHRPAHAATSGPTCPRRSSTRSPTVDGVAAADPHVTTAGLDQLQPRARAPTASPSAAARAPPQFENWIDDDALSPFDLDRRPGARAATTRSCSTSPPPRRATSSVGDTGRASSAQDGPQDVHARRHVRPRRRQERRRRRHRRLHAARGAAARRARRRDQPRSTSKADDGVSPGGAGGRRSRRRARRRRRGDHRRGGRRPAVEREPDQLRVPRRSPSRSSARIALLVGIFVISNTFSILVAQRTKELALLRALGASRAQVLGSVLLEATRGRAWWRRCSACSAGCSWLTRASPPALEASGASLPNAALVVAPDTIVLVAAHRRRRSRCSPRCCPRIRATRVPPLAALRDVADRPLQPVPGPHRRRRRRARASGAFNLSAAWRADGRHRRAPRRWASAPCSPSSASSWSGRCSPGAPSASSGLPLPRFRGVTGRLATENAARSPKRTSATASAVVIGVALVVFIKVFAASASRVREVRGRARVRRRLRRQQQARRA